MDVDSDSPLLAIFLQIVIAKSKTSTGNIMLRDSSQTLVRGEGPDAKRGHFKFLTLVRGALKKITSNFPVKIEFTCYSMGLTRNFHGKRGVLKFSEV